MSKSIPMKQRAMAKHSDISDITVLIMKDKEVFETLTKHEARARLEKAIGHELSEAAIRTAAKSCEVKFRYQIGSSKVARLEAQVELLTTRIEALEKTCQMLMDQATKPDAPEEQPSAMWWTTGKEVR